MSARFHIIVIRHPGGERLPALLDRGNGEFGRGLTWRSIEECSGLHAAGVKSPSADPAGLSDGQAGA